MTSFFFFFFFEILQIVKFKGADLTYDNSFFQILAQKYLNKAFLVLSLISFVSLPNFAISQIRG